MEKALPGKHTTSKMPEWKMHSMENERKSTYWKMIDFTLLENARMENAQPGK